MAVCLRVLSSHSDLMKDVFGELSRTALVSMLAANDSKNGKEGWNEVSVVYWPIQLQIIPKSV